MPRPWGRPPRLLCPCLLRCLKPPRRGAQAGVLTLSQHHRLYSKVGGGWWRCRGGVLLLLLLLPLTFTAALTFAGLPTTAAPAAAVQRPSLLLTSLLLRCGW